MPGHIWTRDKLIEAIQKLHAEGVDLSPTAVQQTHGALFSSARSPSHFGNWRAAVEAAGFDYDEIKRTKERWSRDEILEQICLHHKNGDDVLSPTFKISYRDLYLAASAHRYFGSWRRAIAAAGLDHETLRESRVWTRARIIRTIQEMARHDRPLSWAFIEVSCPGIYRAARRRENFGSWHNALIAAGVQTKLRGRGRLPNALKQQMQAREDALKDGQKSAPDNLDIPIPSSYEKADADYRAARAMAMTPSRENQANRRDGN